MKYSGAGCSCGRTEFSIEVGGAVVAEAVCHHARSDQSLFVEKWGRTFSTFPTPPPTPSVAAPPTHLLLPQKLSLGNNEKTAAADWRALPAPVVVTALAAQSVKIQEIKSVD